MKDNLNFNRTESFEQTKSWLETELANRTTLSPNIDKLIFVGLTNRTNTGSLATGLGRSPINSPITRHIQPYKAIAIQIMESEGVYASTPRTFFRNHIDLDKGRHLIKETVGPGTDNPAEWVDAIGILLSKGIDPKKLTFVPTFRDPFDTVASWRRMWEWSWADFPFDSFNKSLRLVSEKITYTRNLGMKVVPYVHEFLRDFDRFTVVEKMCVLIDIPYSPRMVDWDNPNTAADDTIDWYFEGPLIKYDQPPDRWVQGALGVAHGGPFMATD